MVGRLPFDVGTVTCTAVAVQPVGAPLTASAMSAWRDDATVITRAFSGRAARGLANRFTREMSGAPLAPYPAQNALTREIRAAAAKHGDSTLLSLWAGQAAALAREIPAGETIGYVDYMDAATLRRWGPVYS